MNGNLECMRIPLIRRFVAAVPFVLLAACGNEPNPPGSLDCADVSPTSLAVGEFTIVDAAHTACVRLPAAGGSEVEHLYVALSADGTESQAGTTAGYKLQGGSGIAASAAAPRPAVFDHAPSAAQAFHDMLRAREQDLSRRPALVSAARQRLARSVAAVPPVVGDQRTFEVCANTTCTAFAQSTATAKVVGQRVAIFLDDAAPAGYTQADLDTVGELFDSHLYPIDTTAFGRESDIDGDGVVKAEGDGGDDQQGGHDAAQAHGGLSSRESKSATALRPGNRARFRRWRSMAI